MKKIFYLLVVLILSSLIYTAFKESGWQYNNQERKSITEADYPNLDSIERALTILAESQYAAIVYPKRTILHGDNWFSRNILPPEHWEATTTAEVILTIRGKSYPTIEYNSLSSYLSNNAIFVGLCIDNETGLHYTPDNGFEIPATDELITYFNNYNEEISSLPRSEESPCTTKERTN